MAEFFPNKPIETTEPQIKVTLSPTAPLPIGVNRFQLVVVDDSGNTSEPAIREVIIRDTQRPTSVLDAPKAVEAGNSFVLDATRSSDVPPGKVVKYIWTLIETPDRPIISPIIPTPRLPLNPLTPPIRNIDITNPTI